MMKSSDSYPYGEPREDTQLSDFLLMIGMSLLILAFGVHEITTQLEYNKVEVAKISTEDHAKLLTVVKHIPSDIVVEKDPLEVIADEVTSYSTVESLAENLNVEESLEPIMYDSAYLVEAYDMEDYYCIKLNSRGFKSYMSYKAITNTSSLQYRLQNEYAYTGEYGIRQVNGRFCVVLGSASTAAIGDYVDLVLENGNIIHCIMSDQKADIHTLDDNLTTAANGCVSEFIIDKDALVPAAKRAGSVSAVDASWNSPVCEIRIFKANIFD